MKELKMAGCDASAGEETDDSDGVSSLEEVSTDD